MLARNSVKVGVVVLLALALGLVLYNQLAHLKASSYSVRVVVGDTQGLSSQSIVRMEGVAIGEVTSVDLDKDNKPLIYLAIRKRYRIPAGSLLKISSGILITQAQVQIVPSKSHDFLPTDNMASINAETQRGGMIAQIDPDLAATFGKLDKTFTIITDRFNDAYAKIAVVLTQTQHLMSTANNIAGNANSFISDPKLRKTLMDSLENVHQTTESARIMTSQLRMDMDDLVADGKARFKDLGPRVSALFDHIDETVQDADTVVKKFTEQVTDPHLQQSLQDTAAAANATIARFNQIASDIHSFTGDPAVQGDLKRAVTSLSEAAASGKEAMEKINQLVGKIADTTHKAPKIPQVKVQVNDSEQVQSGPKNRLDIEATVPFGTNYFGFTGLYDVGQTTGFDLQAGKFLSKSFDVRGGLYDSKLGLGLDYMPSPGTGLRADVYNQNTPHLDVRGLYRVYKNASVWIGGDNVTRTPIPMIGVQLTN